MQKLFLNKWIPMEDKYIKKCRSKRKSDLIFQYKIGMNPSIV